MIRYALKCGRGHAFESWFRSAEAFETLRAAGHVACPECGATDVAKALMAPQVRPARKAAARSAPEAQSPAPSPADPEAERRAAREAAIAELRRRVEANSEYVGVQFAAEARRIQSGESPERSIYGEARVEDARALIEEGVPVAPLPFVPLRRAN